MPAINGLPSSSGDLAFTSGWVQTLDPGPPALVWDLT